MAKRTKPNKITVSLAGDSGWTARKPGAKRASFKARTQAEAIQRAREQLRREGGGELAIKNTKGRVRAQDTVPDGNDPRTRRG